MIRVAVADDQPLVRMGLRMLVDAEADLDLVGEACDGREALDLVRGTRPDVLLLDIRMPVLDGLAVLREVVADPALGGTRVVVVTTFELDEYVFAAISGGASGFVLKDAPPTDLLRAVRVVAAGEALLSPSVTRRLIGAFSRREVGPAPDAPDLSELTAREREIVALVGAGLSNEEIGRRLYISPATARTHVSRSMIKLAARDRAQLAVFAHRAGLTDGF